ncbi:MAG: N-acetyltransferase [Desulfobulbaceae bacterium]|uniref:N-acetyltransferase n=1 Tax=Candidatus Desulfatifera sulfidica TaxID=2841691 RepID=A0A8J6TAV6_9BACT|nr:N-acetyltransferase [Candidatus Desulfatifera sulfidica]
MKIRKLTPEDYPKATALLRQAFPHSTYEMKLVDNLHKNGTPIHEWVCIHTNKIIAYIAFTNAYHDTEVCGLHLAPFAVKPEFQRQGVGSELLRFALRQQVIKDSPIFVLGETTFYQRFGFEKCSMPICPFAENNRHFMSIRNKTLEPFTVGYELEFGQG